MALLVADAAEAVMLANILNKTAPQNLLLKLYTNDYTPVEGETEASYTEAAGFGYAALTLTGANWTITPGAPSLASYAQQTFTFSGALGLVYGYFVVQAVSGLIMWGERFTDGPYTIAQAEDQIRINPSLSLT